jgi:hypothetical protein
VSNWFLQKLEGNVQSEVGPLSPTELLTLVRRGEIKPETRLRKNDSAWFPASDVGGLFEAAARQEVRFHCPACNHQVPKPPVTCPKCLRDIGRSEARVVQPEPMRSAASAPQRIEESEELKSVQSWLRKKVRKRK